MEYPTQRTRKMKDGSTTGGVGSKLVAWWTCGDWRRRGELCGLLVACDSLAWSRRHGWRCATCWRRGDGCGAVVDWIWGGAVAARLGCQSDFEWGKKMSVSCRERECSEREESGCTGWSWVQKQLVRVVKLKKRGCMCNFKKFMWVAAYYGAKIESARLSY